MDHVDRRMLLAGAGIAGVAALAKLSKAGPLDPPPGAVASTGRQLSEVYDKVARTSAGIGEPRIPVQSLAGSGTAVHVITQPGSYYLTENVVGAGATHGIAIQSSDVSLDLCGFAVRGQGQGLNGIHAPGYTNIRVVNGAVVGWGGNGVEVGYGCLVEGICASNNALSGVVVATGVVRWCSSRSNAQSGFRGTGVTFEGCRAESNIGVGFWCSFASSADACVADGNGAGFYVEQDSTARSCVARSSVSQGFVVREGARALACESYGHADGFAVHRAVCDGCHAANGTSAGFSAGVGSRAFIVRCVASGNPSNFAIGAGNAHGPIVNGAGVGDISAVAGSSHPAANISY